MIQCMIKSVYFRNIQYSIIHNIIQSVFGTNTNKQNIDTTILVFLRYILGATDLDC